MAPYFPNPAADILISCARPVGFVKHKRDLNITKGAQRANEEVVYKY